MPLKSYHQKRNFHKTREPRGARKKATRKKTDTLMFVVQEHHASHLHYDFRLEWKGVLKSWAVPKGPSLDPHLKRLAIEVEDHPLEYGSFEGVIPEKHYGAGRVYIWDSGIWIPKGAVSAGFKKGHLEFELKGHRLKGTWDLIRTASQGRSPQWLLMKKQDSFAKDEKIMPFVPPMLANLVESPPQGKGWLHEQKFDGYRIQAHIVDGKVRFFTRSGHDWSDKMTALQRVVGSLDVQSAVLDGEVVVPDEAGVSHFQKLQNHFSNEEKHRLVFRVFDLLMLNGEDLRGLPLQKRRRALSGLLKGRRSPQIKISEEIKKVTPEVLRKLSLQGIEGVVSKKLESTYQSGRKGEWVKSKFLNRQEFVIGGYTVGRGGRESFGALMLGVYEGRRLRYVGKVGTGFSDKSISSLLPTLQKSQKKNSPFGLGDPPKRGSLWVQPKLLAEVTFANWTQSRHLRAPVFIGLRKDKRIREVVAESILLSNPEKILFPEKSITKLDVAKYYIAVESLMRPYYEKRLLSLLRCPEGVSKACFFQKHLSERTLSSNVHQNGDFISIDDIRGLLEVVQMGAFEIHGNNATIDAPELPDQCVIDLDPGESVSWKQVVSAAQKIKKKMEALGLVCFVKLSGGKGLHIHVPFRPGPSWSEVKAFTRQIALEMERQEPEKYVSKMGKSLRKGKIFIDYLRNSHGATSVLPYSLRAREEAAVAWPVSWQKLSGYGSGDAITLQRALWLLKRQGRDPWGRYFHKPPVLPIPHLRI